MLSSHSQILLISIGIVLSIAIGRIQPIHGQRVIPAQKSHPFILQRFDTYVRFEVAKSYCESQNAWLVEIKTDKLNEDLKKVVGNTAVWIGGNYTSADGWRWLDGSPLFLGEGSIDDLNTAQCLTFNAASGVSTKPCHYTAQYVCQIASLSTFFHGEFEFRIPSQIFASVTIANDACVAWNENAHLVDIVDKATDDQITNHLNRRPEATFYYTSGNDNAEEDNWVWSDGSTISSYRNWKSYTWTKNEPNGRSNENCLVKYLKPDWKWYDFACDKRLKAICQRRIDNSSCSDDLCSEHGSCVVQTLTPGMIFHCYCDSPYMGRLCEIDPCQPNPCQNSGSCKYLINSPYYTCDCTVEYHGDNCGERTFEELDDCAYHINLLKKVTHEQALIVCSTIESSLAILKSQRSSEFIFSKIKNEFQRTNVKIWLGGGKTDQQWSWLDESVVSPMYPSGVHSSDADYKCLIAEVNSALAVTANQCNQYLGYICEKPARGTPCSSAPCLNEGNCKDVGCYYKCICQPGYAGRNCDIDLIEISVSQDEITIMKNDMANISMIVNSRVGRVAVELWSSVASRSKTISSGTHAFKIGPFRTPYYGYKVIFTFTPHDRTFSREAKVTINVADLPTVFTDPADYITLPIVSVRTISCIADRGTPQPSIAWYKGEEKVREDWKAGEIYQLSNALVLPSATKNDAGIYTCRATNTISGEIFLDEKDLYLLLPPQLVEKNTTTTDAGIFVMSCKFESFPSSDISWTYTHNQISKEIKNEPGSIFSYTNRSYENFQEGVLKIALPEWLGEGEIKCIATSKFHTSEGVETINPRAQPYNGMLYTFTHPSNGMTREECEQYCSNIHSEICIVTDEDTDRKLLHYSRTLQDTTVHIGGKAYEVNGTRIWKWSNGRMIYNQSNYHRWKAEYHRIIDGVYVGWASGKPSSHHDKRCMVYVKSTHEQYSWSNVQCASSLPTICQKPIHGSPTIQYAGAGNCSTTVKLSWSPATAALFIKHRVDITPIASDHAVKPNIVEINATEDKYDWEFQTLIPSTTYRIRIYPCPGFCTEEGGVTRYIITGAGIPESNYQVNVSHVVETSTCVVTWSDDHIVKGIIGHMLTVASSLVRASSEVRMAYEDRMQIDLPINDTDYIHNVLPNRNYSFIVQARTCAGLSLPKHGQGKCMTDSAAPNYVPTPISLAEDISQSGIVKITLPKLDQSNGPVSCVFILVDTTNSRLLKGQGVGSSELRSASYSENQQALPAMYVSLALSSEDITNTVSGDSGGKTLIIGDNTTSSCNTKHLPASEESRKKRASDPGQVFHAYNSPLTKGNVYRIFAVSSTPTIGGRVLYKASAPQQVGRASSPSGSSVAWVAGMIVGLLVVVILIGFFIVRRRARTVKVKADTQSMELQEHENGLDPNSPDPLYENYTRDTDDVRSKTDIQMTDLEATYKAMLLNGKEGFQKQYQDLKKNTENLGFPQEYGSDPETFTKNRYKNILPYDKNIVKLTGGAPTNYINASFIEGFKQGNKFIATQGPLTATVNDFWRMVIEQECHTIVMLTKCVENTKKKCAKYWPDLGQTQAYGPVTVKNEREELKSGYIVRSFNASVGRYTLCVQQYQYLNWPDHGVPATTSDFFRLHRAMSVRLESNSSVAPTIIHCSAGAGRTGAFISYDYLTEERKVLNHVDVYSCVFNLRRQRIQMVQNKDQYIFVYKLLLEDHLFGDTELSAADAMSKTGYQDAQRTLDKEFANLNKLKPIQCSTSERMPPAANRKGFPAPYTHSVVVLQPLPYEDSAPFINASYIPTYHDSMTMIAAQGPDESGIDIFWRAIFDCNVSVLIMLTNCIEGDEQQCARYWPNDVGDVMTLQCMTVRITNVYSLNEKAIARTFLLVREQASKTVIQYQYKDWPSTTSPTNTAVVLDLISKLKEATRQTNNPTILVHCSDGAGRTGAFCTLVNVIDRLNAENVVDVFRAAKDLRDFRPGMINDATQYKFCYKAISEYLENSSVYSIIDVETKESLYANM